MAAAAYNDSLIIISSKTIGRLENYFTVNFLDRNRGPKDSCNLEAASCPTACAIVQRRFVNFFFPS